MFSIRRWRAPHLLAAWIGYWVVLVAVALSGAARVVWQLSQRPNAKVSASAGFGDGRLGATIAEAGRTLWELKLPLPVVVLWLVVPPLVLWLLWVAQRPRRAPAPRLDTMDATREAPQLGGPGIDDAAWERERVRHRTPT